MKIEFSDQQLTLLKEVLAEYAEMCYQEMFDYKRIALEADDSVTLSYYESEQLQYKWLLAQADTSIKMDHGSEWTLLEQTVTRLICRAQEG